MNPGSSPLRPGEDVDAETLCSADPTAHRERIEQLVAAIGPDQGTETKSQKNAGRSTDDASTRVKEMRCDR
jgi:hypothetical protein